MAEYKNQHYVPQFYLRAFSFGGAKKIALFNLKQNKIVSSTNIDSQCAEDYFYGTDSKPERALSSFVEAPASKVINDIIKSDAIPEPFTEDYATLFAFALFQHSRTLYASEEGTELFQTFIEPNLKQMAIESGKFTLEEVKDIKFRSERPANRTITTATEMFPLILDLKVKLLINRTTQDFITSDNPVVKINQYFRGRSDQGVTGWAAKGLQVFVPISPKHTLIFYDEKIYKVGSRKSDIVLVTQEADTVALNILQLVNAHENVYFREPMQGGHISKQFTTCCNSRRKKKVVTKLFQTIDETGRPCQVQHAFTPDIDFRHSFSFCKVQTARKQIPPQNRDYDVRQPELIAVHRKFLDDVDVGKYQLSDWLKFLGDMTKGRIK